MLPYSFSLVKSTIYNYFTGHINPLTWDQFRRKSFDIGRTYPLEVILWYPSASVKNDKYLNQMDICLYHYPSAYVIDTVARKRGKRPRMVSTAMLNWWRHVAWPNGRIPFSGSHLRQSSPALPYLDFYMNRQWWFNSNNLVKWSTSCPNRIARRSISTCVKSTGPGTCYVIGTRQFILKEDPSTFPAGRIQQIEQ